MVPKSLIDLAEKYLRVKITVQGLIRCNLILFHLKSDSFLSGKWGPLYGKYPRISRSRQAHWANLITFFQYPKEIRKVIYTTNAIESLNIVIRKACDRHRLFPNDRVAMKIVYLTVEQASKNWSMPIHNWNLAINQFMIWFEDRLPSTF